MELLLLEETGELYTKTVKRCGRCDYCVAKSPACNHGIFAKYIQEAWRTWQTRTFEKTVLGAE